MKCWIKIGVTVTLISLLSADIGLQAALWFGAPTRPIIIVPQQATQGESDKGAANHPKSNNLDNISLLVAMLGAGGTILTLFVIGYQTFIFHGQRKIMGQQTDLLARQLNFRGHSSNIMYIDCRYGPQISPKKLSEAGKYLSN